MLGICLTCRNCRREIFINLIRDKFLKLKEESNKVHEQQQRNFEALQAVRAAYKKAYDEIMGKYQDSKKKIKEGTSLDSIKPKIE